MGFRRAAFACFVVAFGCGLSSIFAQAPTGDITGVVEDESGGVVQRAKHGHECSDRDGPFRHYRPDGDLSDQRFAARWYSVTAEARGLQKVSRNIVVQVGNTESPQDPPFPSSSWSKSSRPRTLLPRRVPSREVRRRRRRVSLRDREPAVEWEESSFSCPCCSWGFGCSVGGVLQPSVRRRPRSLEVPRTTHG